MLLLCFSFATAHASTFNIGVLSFQSKENTMKKWAYLETYLNEQINSSESFKVIPMFYDELDSAIAKGTIDFVLTNTGHYVMLEKKWGISAIASLEKKVGGNILDSFGGVIFTRSDRTDIRNLKDLKGASFIAVQAESLGGYLAAAGELQKNGINPKEDFRQLLFTGMPHEKVVKEVLAGKADAGTVRTGVLESLIAAGTIQADDFKILNAKTSPDFTLLHSTALYPEWPFSVMPHTDDAIANEVALALISETPSQHRPYFWKVSRNYKPVHQLMMDLKVPPYENNVDIWALLKEHVAELLAALILLLVLTYFLISLYQANRKLLISKKHSKNTTKVLEYIAASENLTKTLNQITGMIESDFPSIRSSILLLKKGRLYKGAAPSLPENYNNALEGLEIGSSVGSCGTAAYLGERVIVEDIATNPLWAPYKDLALKYDLRSCWSEPIFDNKGKVLGTFAMYSDYPHYPSELQLKEISSAAHLAGIAIVRERNESRLRKLAQTVEQTGEAVLITDQKGNIEFVNKAFTEMTGYSFDEVLGKNPNILSSGRQDKQFYHDMWKELQDTGTWTGRIWNKRKNGKEYLERLHITAVKNDAEGTHYIGLFLDITEQLSVEEQLRHAQKMEATGTLVGGIAHDFNNILAGMLGNAYLIKKKCQDQPRLLEKVKNIEELGFRAGDLIKQMLAFARKGVMEKSNIDFSVCVRKSIQLIRVALPKEILIQENIGKDELTIFADDTLLQQVVINLLNNARDAVEHVSEPEIKVSLQCQNSNAMFRKSHEKADADNYACLSISDNGCGMSNEVMEHVYDPFYTTKAVNKGTGLGLSMALGTIQSHHGFIDIESELGKGSSFHIYLPLVGELRHVGEKTKTFEPSLKGKAHILIADDEPQILEMLVEVLEEDGYTVYSAKNGKDALSVYLKHKDIIHLAILDVSMPGMSGIQVAKEIRKTVSGLPIIFNSGYDKTDMPNELTDCEGCLKLQKPVEIHVLKRSIYDLLGIRD